jgi:parallel beta-helix repeat protein
MGADAAGFLIIHNSSRNFFRRNLARLGGDGFFLAGLSPQMQPVPCNDNRFEENDSSYSPNIGFEATFSSGNVWINNTANFCNYGFWLGFSSNGILENNKMIGCRQAGIATEMGFNFQVRNNIFRENEHGILLWSKYIPEFLIPYPANNNSYAWQIEENTFIHNGKGIRIAANQDHGIRAFKVPEGQDIKRFCRPFEHVVQRNIFQDNRTAIEALDTDGTVQQMNIFEHNVENNFVEI